jgi:hypothetical protein
MHVALLLFFAKCSAAIYYYITVNGIDTNSGTNLAEISSSYQYCQSSCEATATCLGFVFKPVDQKCWLRAVYNLPVIASLISMSYLIGSHG